MTYNKAYIQGLIIERAAGTISQDDDSLLERAVKDDPEIEAMWREMQQVLNTDKARTFFNTLDENKAWNKIDSSMANVRSANSGRMGFIKWLSVAALLCVAIVVFYYWQSRPVNEVVITQKNQKKPAIELQIANGQRIDLSDTSKRVIIIPFAHLKKGANGLSYQLSNNKTQQWSTLVIPPKLNYRIVLSDGTQVWLNSASNLRFPFAFTGATREVYLDGEAFFKVAKNAAHPFIVHTDQTDVKVLGTQFNVNTYKTNVTTTSLVEGSVTTAGKNNQKLLLRPGYQAVYAPTTGFLTQPFDADMELAWMHDIYYFHDTKLHDISEVLLRWFDVKVVFDDPAKADESFSGAIQKSQPIEIFIQNIKASAGVNAVFKDGVLHIK
jgi:transmembrane sensor